MALMTLDGFEDLLAALRDRPDWRDELRRVLLTDDLHTLPHEVTRIARAVTSLAEAQTRTHEAQTRTHEAQTRTHEAQTRTEEHLATLTDRLDTLTERLDTLTERVDTLTERVDALAEQMATLTERLDALTENVATLTDRLDALTENVATLTDRLDALTENVATLTDRLDALTENVATLAERVDALTEAQARTEARLQSLVEQVAEMAGHVEWLKGDALERRYRERAPAYLGRIAKRLHTLTTDEVEELLAPATEARRLTDEEAQQIRLADGIVRGRREGDEVYLVLEVSWGVGLGDVQRAEERAALLTKAGRVAMPVVAGTWLTPDVKRAAPQLGVWQVSDGTVVPPEEHAA
jgi:chromosome segregation ATPase